jgi:16S rRNA (uracil1498-N3)-methyltransferase
MDASKYGESAVSGARPPRFFVEPGQIDEAAGNVRITGNDVRHIRDALRKKTGDALVACNGLGVDYICAITASGKDAIVAAIADKRQSAGEPSVSVILWQCLPKGDKFDRIVKMAVEAGVSGIVPVLSERTLLSELSATRSPAFERRRARWQRISEEAAKQSGRGRVPRVTPPVALFDAIRRCAATDTAADAATDTATDAATDTAAGAATDTAADAAAGSASSDSQPARAAPLCAYSIMPYEECSGYTLKDALRDMPPSCGRINVFIGSEGGFAPGEIAFAASAGIKPLTLGPRILRTETAGIAAIASIMLELET